jgi:MFS family permease
MTLFKNIRMPRMMTRRMSRWRNAAWWGMLPLIFVQFASGMRDLPQTTFFPIYLREQLGLAPAAISVIVAGGQIAGMITALLGGAVTSRLGSKWVLVCGSAFAILGSLSFQATAVWLVVLLWFCAGIGIALITVGGASYLTGLNSKAGLGTLAAFYALSMTFGGAVGNPLAGLMIEQYGFSAFSWYAIGISVCTILIIMLIMPDLQGQTNQGTSIVSLWSEIRYTIRQTNVQMLVGLRSLPTIFYGMISLLIPLMLFELSGSKVLVAAYGTTNLILASAAQLLIGRAGDRWGARRPTIVAYSLLVCSGIGLALSVHSLPALFAFGVLGIASAWSLSTMMYVWVNDGVPRREHPPTFGLLHAIWSVSMIAGSVFGGWLVTTLPALPFLAAGLLNISSVFLIRIFYRRVDSNPPENT